MDALNAIVSNLHTHTFYSDGSGSPEEYVLAAIRNGFLSIGFSDHAYNSYDYNSRTELEDMPRYLAEMRGLKQRYASEIEIYTGIESDYLELAGGDFDYMIGSTHFVRDSGGKYYSIDESPQHFDKALRALGGIQPLARTYYAQVAGIACNQKPDIIGHFDLILKFNGIHGLIDVESGWYASLVEEAVDAIAASGCIVEVNTGGMSRGCTTHTYPTERVLRAMLARHIPVTVSSDAHSVKNLCFRFDETAELLRQIGFQTTRQLIGGRFVEIPL